MYETCRVHSPVPCKLHDGDHDDDAEAASLLLLTRAEFDHYADVLAAELKSLGYTGAEIVNYFIHWAERWGG
jgi:hypothetical protein